MSDGGFFGEHIVLIFFLYGLAFFSMGLAVWLESGRASQLEFARALRPLAGFGIAHGAHEWLEMFQKMAERGANGYLPALWFEAVRVLLLVSSFWLLASFGACLLRRQRGATPRICPVAATLTLLWAVSIAFAYLRLHPSPLEWLAMGDALSRYLIAMPGGVIACLALVRQQQLLRGRGMERFGRDLLWAAIAFFWYGVVGQAVVRRTPLFPSSILNSEAFLALLGFPVQLLRASMACLIAIFIIRALRAFDLERQQRLAEANAARVRVQQEMLHRVVNAQEAERQRIARELHDETSQTLTALSLGLKGIEQTIATDPARAQRQLAELKKAATDALDALHRCIADLRPPQLDDLGLIAALRWYVDDFQERAGLSVTLTISGARRRLSPEIETMLFRVTQEALSNVARHAQAQRAWIEVEFGERQVRLMIGDDGRGFFPAAVLNAPSPRRAWGLLGIQERVGLVGGTFQIRSQPGEGAEITVTAPLSSTEAAEPTRER